MHQPPCTAPSTIRWEISNDFGTIVRVLYTCDRQGHGPTSLGPVVRQAGWVPQASAPPCGTTHRFDQPTFPA